jgi:hypothetical protein
VRGVADFGMAQKRLYEPGIGAFIRQGIAGRMPQHVRMHLDVQLAQPACLSDDVLQSIIAAALPPELLAAATRRCSPALTSQSSGSHLIPKKPSNTNDFSGQRRLAL